MLIILPRQAHNKHSLGKPLRKRRFCAFSGKTIFLNLDGECFVDWMRFVPASNTQAQAAAQ
jgi:hypothetical protein